MAETIVAELVKSIAEKFGSQFCSGITFASDVNTQIKELQETRNALEATLLDADSKQVLSHSQRDVLEKLDLVLAKLINFQDWKTAKAKQKELMKGSKFTKELRTFFSSSNQLVSPYQDARKIKAITGELSLIARNYSQFGSIVGSSSVNQTQSLSYESGSRTCTDMVIGRDGDRDNIVALLLDPSNGAQVPSVVSIVGMGGIGKTTLAQHVYNDERVNSSFDLKLWVYVTQDFNVKDLLQKILASATGEKPLYCEMDQLQSRLFHVIAGRKFLLVLDNVWDHDSLRAKWLELRSLLQLGVQGSKVLLTTRSETVAATVGTENPYMLCDLQEDDCWLLFQHIACTQWHELGVEAIGKMIVKMCPKNPLVIEVIGSLLAGKQNVRDWRAFRNDQLANFASYGRDVMGTLKLSYDQLDVGLKLCVAFCSLFPKGHVYVDNDLIHLWIAMGYVKREYANQSLEDAAERYMWCLVKQGFFKSKLSLDMHYCFQMPDLMHDLVLSIVGSKYKMADSSTNVFDEMVCHVSYFSTNNEVPLPWKIPYSLFKIKQLQSLLLPIPQLGCIINHGIILLPNDVFISRFQSLRSLRLHGLGIKKLPSSVGDLIQLRYLDLSNNPIRKLPNSITQLVNLYVLNLSFCERLEELPKYISNLVMLRHLNLCECGSLSHMPKELGRLTALETLNRFVVNNYHSESKANSACGFAELKELDNLNGSLTIVVLRQSKDVVMEAKTANLKSKEYLTEIILEFTNSSKEDEMVLDNLQPNANLRFLKIENYGGERLPRWMGDQLHCCLPNLVIIFIGNCNACKCLSAFGRLPHLKYIFLRGLENVEYIENDGCGDNTLSLVNKTSSTPLFPSLYMLSLLDMPKLKGWCSVANTSQLTHNQDHDHLLNIIPTFPKLKDLSLNMELVVRMAIMWSPGIASLKTLTILGKESQSICEVVPSTQQRQHVVPLKSYLPNLYSLYFKNEHQMKYLPEDFRDMSSLTDLNFTDCKALETLPGWIDSLTSLKRLSIENCPSFTSFPQEMSNLSNLKQLTLRKCSRQLAQRCREPTGEDWPKIHHIPSIYIEPADDDVSVSLKP